MNKRDLKADLEFVRQSGFYDSIGGVWKIAEHAIERAIKAETLIAEILEGLSELKCSNHACYFNPPRGMGTNGGCSCLSELPTKLRVALVKTWVKSRKVMGDA